MRNHLMFIPGIYNSSPSGRELQPNGLHPNQMGWKTINGNRYYYRSERDGSSVRTSYVGSGDMALLFAALDFDAQRERREAWDAARSERRAAEAEDRDIAEWFARVEAVA